MHQLKPQGAHQVKWEVPKVHAMDSPLAMRSVPASSLILRNGVTVSCSAKKEGRVFTKQVRAGVMKLQLTQ